MYPHKIDKSLTTVRIKKTTLERLNAVGRKGETYEDIIVWLLDHSKKKR